MRQPTTVKLIVQKTRELRLTNPNFEIESQITTIFVKSFAIMDNLDLLILSQLQRDGRRPFTKIAGELGVTEGTVRKRVNRLVEDQVVKIIGLVDPHKVGFDSPAIIQVNTTPAQLESAAQVIQAFHEVSYLLMVSGEFDLLVEVRCRDQQHLGSFVRDKLQQVPGVTRTVSSMVLHTYKLAEVDVTYDISLQK